MTIAKAKKIVKAWLNAQQLSCRLTGKTVSFVDLARGSYIFIRVHGWKPCPAWNELQTIATENGFRIEAY